MIRLSARSHPRRWSASAAGVALVVAMVAFAAGCRSERASDAPAPIIFILVDALRADYLGVYGFNGDISPHVDRLAAESVLLRNCFAQAPWTKPSIASLFTSLHVPVHRVIAHHGRFGTLGGGRGRKTETLPDAAVTLAEGLRGTGYSTAAFVANPWLLSTHGFAQGFEMFNDSVRGNGVTADRVFRAVSKWMRKVPAERLYFAYIHLMDVHGPYDAPAAHYDAVRDSASLGPSVALDKNERQRIPMYLRRSHWFGKDVNDARVVRGHYAAGMRALDQRLGVFFEELREKGVWDRAIIVFTSDHGEQLHEHGGWDHGFSLYDEELHVPLIIKLPGGRHGGREVLDVVSLVDVMPTLLALAGAPPAEGAQGRDLSPLLVGEEMAAASASFATAVKWKPGLHSARTQRYKLIQDVNKEMNNRNDELFDLREDPNEQHPVSHAPPALAETAAVLNRHFADNANHVALKPGTVEVSPEAEERLRALGYD